MNESSPYFPKRTRFTTASTLAFVLLPAFAIPAYSIVFSLLRLRELHWRLFLALLPGMALWGLPLLLTTGAGAAAEAAIQVLLVGVVASTFAGLRKAAELDLDSVLAGFSLGFLILALVSVAQLSGALHPLTLRLPATDIAAAWQEQLQPLRFPGRSWGWASHPNIWGASAVVLANFVLLNARRSGLYFLSLSFAMATVVLSGSRTSMASMMLAVLLVVISSGRLDLRRAGLSVTLTLASLVALLLMIDISSPRLDLLRTASTLRATPASDGPGNLVRSSERFDDTVVWKRHDVEVSLWLGAGHENAWAISKTSRLGGEARLYQRLSLTQGESYSGSLELRPLDDNALPGLVGTISSNGQHEGEFALLKTDDGWIGRDSGSLEISRFETTTGASGWETLSFKFSADDAADTLMTLALVPDRRLNATATLLVMKPQVNPGSDILGYHPTYPGDYRFDDAFRAARARIPLFMEAWEGFRERPLIGWGLESQLATGNSSHGTHAHNALLQVLFERGLVGLTGLVLVMLPLFLLGGTHAPRMILMVIIVVLNSTDYTLWSGSVIYPLSAICGWFAAAPGNEEHPREIF